VADVIDTATGRHAQAIDRGGTMKLANDWRGRVRWFAAQFVVIVTGVLVALAANDWAQRAREQRLAEEYAVRIVEDLDRIALSLEGVIHWTAALESAGDVLLPVLEGRLPLRDSLLVMTAAYQASRARAPDLNPIAYRELLATGQIRLFRDPPLRQALGNYFADIERAGAFLNDFPEDYSRIARSALPPAFQIALHGACGNTSSPQECMPPAPPDDMRIGLERLLADTGAAPALRHVLLRQHTVRMYARQQYESNRALRQLLEGSLRRDIAVAGSRP
jgi:hypothetical protein